MIRSRLIALKNDLERYLDTGIAFYLFYMPA